MTEPEEITQETPPEEPSGETPPATEAAPGEPSAAPPPEEPDPRVGQLQDELEWFRNQHDGTVQDLAAARRELQEYQTSAMTDEERAGFDLSQQGEQLQEREIRLAQKLYEGDLKALYSQYVPASVLRGNDPSRWQRDTLEHLKGNNRKLQQEVQTLRKAAKPGARAPKVPSATGGKTGKKTLGQHTWAEIEDMQKRALAGQLSEEDYPPVE